MPTYEYSCNNCLAIWDHVRPIAKRDDEAPCPHCGTVETTRTIGAPMVMRVSLPDGTKRFDKVRQSQALLRQERTESDKKRKAALRRERQRLVEKT